MLPPAKRGNLVQIAPAGQREVSVLRTVDYSKDRRLFRVAVEGTLVRLPADQGGKMLRWLINDAVVDEKTLLPGKEVLLEAYEPDGTPRTLQVYQVYSSAMRKS
jgi:hypothetical protein